VFSLQMTPNQNELAFWLSGLWHSSFSSSICNRWEKAAPPLSPINKRSFCRLHKPWVLTEFFVEADVEFAFIRRLQSGQSCRSKHQPSYH
jgi:hypothetical protein